MIWIYQNNWSKGAERISLMEKEKIKNNENSEVKTVTREELRGMINDLEDGTIINVILRDPDEDEEQGI